MLRKALIAILLAASAHALGAASYEDEIEPLLDIYCYGCHGDGSSKGDFSMDEFDDLSSHLKDKKHWLPVWRNVRSQIMPPSDEDQLSIDEKRQLLAWIEREVFELDPANPDPGRVTIRRLNRTEYENAIYDLLGVEFDTTEAFPPDDTGYGFDNIGDVLSISPLLMEKYIAAADAIVEEALPEGAAAQVPRVDVDGALFADSGDPELSPAWIPFRSGGKVRATTEVAWDGDYEVTLEYAVRGAEEATDAEAMLEMRAGGELVGEEHLGWDQRRTIQLVGKVSLKKGRSELAISLAPLRDPSDGEEELFLAIQRVILRGPMDGSQTEYSKGYRMIFVDGPPPGDTAGKERYARKIFRSFVSRAFRRPLDDGTNRRLQEIVRTVESRPGKDFVDGIKMAIATCLCSPRFLFRAEVQPEPNNPEQIVPLDEYALAARLSFFLWGSVPDDELLSLAFNQKLRAEQDAQIERMLADPRSERLVEHFVGQWLQTRNLDTIPVQPQVILDLPSKREASLAFDVRLREDMRREAELLFDFILREGRPAEELISARFSFLNERLAGFYGIDGVEGEEFRPVDLTVHPERGGILTQGAFLVVSSNPTRTSPVKRGLFVLDNLLGTPAPPAPPDVPELEESEEGGGEGPRTMREMMEIHRENPDCRGCHARMDPIGLGLENFNALGQFRRQENGKPIDAAGELITGEDFTDIATLKEILASGRRDDFYRCLAEKLLTYAIGRGPEYYDAPTIDALVDRMKANNGSLRELVVGIIESAPFQKRRGTN